MPNGGGGTHGVKEDSPDYDYVKEIQALKEENAQLRAIHVASRIWCDKAMEKYQMDPDACEAISNILVDVMVGQES